MLHVLKDSFGTVVIPAVSATIYLIILSHVAGLTRNLFLPCPVRSRTLQKGQLMKRTRRKLSRKLVELFKTPWINRKYKDILFRFILADKKVLLKLYNALNETDYNDVNELEINTLENVMNASSRTSFGIS